MRAITLFLVFAVVAVVSPGFHARADIRIASTQTAAEAHSRNVILIRGDRMRIEEGVGTPSQRISIQDCESGEIIQINDRNKAYRVNREASESDTGGGATAEGATAAGGAAIIVSIKAHDTGEEKEILGRSARHIITEISTDAKTNCLGNLHIKQDGWYIDFSSPLGCSPEHTLMRDLAIKAGCSSPIRFRHTSDAKPGYPVLLTTTVEGGVSIQQETTEISTTEVDPALFQIPSGYHESKNMQEFTQLVSAKSTAKGVARRPATPRASTVAVAASPVPAKSGARVGVVVVHVTGPGDGNAIREQLLQVLGQKNLEAIALEQEGKEEAVTEAKEKKCDFVVFTDLSLKEIESRAKPRGTAGKSPKASAKGVLFEALADFQAVPVENPSAHADGNQYFRSMDIKESITNALGQEVNVLVEAFKRFEMTTPKAQDR